MLRTAKFMLVALGLVAGGALGTAPAGAQALSTGVADLGAKSATPVTTVAWRGGGGRGFRGARGFGGPRGFAGARGFRGTPAFRGARFAGPGYRTAFRPGYRPGFRPGVRPGFRPGFRPGYRPVVGPGPVRPGWGRPGWGAPGWGRPGWRPPPGAWGPGRWYPGWGWYRPGWGWGYYNNTGAWIALGVAGAALGAAAVSAYDNSVVDNDAVAYCMSRFKSYNPATGTYLGYDGLRHPCP